MNPEKTKTAMHENSLPPSDRQTPGTEYLSGDALRDAITKTGASLAQIARAIRKSDATLSLWRNRKYNGDVNSLETSLREWLRDRLVARASGVPTIECEVSRAMCRRIDDARRNRECTAIVGPAGSGKSRGQGLFCTEHTLAVCFRVVEWRKGGRALREDLLRSHEIDRRGKGKSWWDVLIEKSTGSDCPLLIDDAHELSPSGLQCCIDYHEETGNPVILSGLPALLKNLARDARRARRIGDVYEVKIKDPLPLVKHMIANLCPNVGNELSDFTSLCIQVVNHDGAFGALEKQLKHACRAREKSSVTWVEAFRAAHKRLLRNYNLN